MFYSMISSTMSSTQKTCQSRGPLPKIGAGEEKHTIPQGSCNEHAEAVKLLWSYSKGVRQSLKDRFVDINDLSL
jgi:hypothetical protein